MLPLIHIYIYKFIIINHSTISIICRINDKNIEYFYTYIIVMVIKLTVIPIIFSVDQH